MQTLFFLPLQVRRLCMVSIVVEMHSSKCVLSHCCTSCTSHECHSFWLVTSPSLPSTLPPPPFYSLPPPPPSLYSHSPPPSSFSLLPPSNLLPSFSHPPAHSSFHSSFHSPSFSPSHPPPGLGLTGIPVFNVNNNCSSGSTALMMAKLLVQARYDCTLAVGELNTSCRRDWGHMCSGKEGLRSCAVGRRGWGHVCSREEGLRSRVQ